MLLLLPDEPVATAAVPEAAAAVAVSEAAAAVAVSEACVNAVAVLKARIFLTVQVSLPQGSVIPSVHCSSLPQSFPLHHERH